MIARVERAAKARSLREEGLKLREIADHMGYSRSTVSDLIVDPDGSRARARKAKNDGACVDCGARTKWGIHFDGPERAMSEGTMQGRNVGVEITPDEYLPGDYGKRGSLWWVCLPNGTLGHLDDRWKVIEHDDGQVTIGGPPGNLCSPECAAHGHDMGPTITVSPSLWDQGNGWHGWLEHGVWTRVS